MSEQELKALPCPNCGKTSTAHERPIAYDNESLWFVMCNDCWTKTKSFLSRKDAVQHWNTRTSPEVEKLVEALEKIANQDYRGNRSTESQIAFAALAAYRKSAQSDKQE